MHFTFICSRFSFLWDHINLDFSFQFYARFSRFNEDETNIQLNCCQSDDWMMFKFKCATFDSLQSYIRFNGISFNTNESPFIPKYLAIIAFSSSEAWNFAQKISAFIHPISLIYLNRGQEQMCTCQSFNCFDWMCYFLTELRFILNSNAIKCKKNY